MKQKGVDDKMVGALIETEARKIWNEAAEKAAKETEEKAAKETALRLIQIGKLTTEEVAVGSGLTVEEVKRIESMQPV